MEGGVPTLYLNDVTVKDGYKYSEFNGDWYYEIYGIYYKSASDNKLTIKLSGTNVIEAKGYTDDKHTGSSETYGIKVENTCTEFSLEGSENAKLKIVSEYEAIFGNNSSESSCVISINGGEYELKTNGTVTSSEGICNIGSLKVESAKINIVSEDDRGIWIKNRSTEGGITSIKTAT